MAKPPKLTPKLFKKLMAEGAELAKAFREKRVPPVYTCPNCGHVLPGVVDLIKERAK